MENQKATETGVQEPKFSEMNAVGKLKHIGKVFVFLLSFGFIFPNIFSD